MTNLNAKLAAQWKDAANLVLGTWLIISPWALSFADQQMPARNAWIVGAVIAIAALAALMAFQKWEEWVNAVLAAWLVVSPWVLGFAANMTLVWNLIVVGALVGGLAIWAALSEGNELATKT